MNFKFSQRSLDRMDGVNPQLYHIAQRAIEISIVDFGVPEHGGLRTAEEQRKLYNVGASKADGYDKRSRHQSGRALDVYAYVGGTASWEKEHLAIVAAAMLQAANELGIKLEWGGFWKGFPDWPHFQLGQE